MIVKKIFKRALLGTVRMMTQQIIQLCSTTQVSFHRKILNRAWNSKLDEVEFECPFHDRIAVWPEQFANLYISYKYKLEMNDIEQLKLKLDYSL